MQVEALRRNRQPLLKIARETGLSRATVARAGKGWEYLHLAVDDHARLAHSEILAG
jgi:hypothetical protein